MAEQKCCSRCQEWKPRVSFRVMPSGRLYRCCDTCHTPRTERRPRAYYKSPEYKRECRARDAAKQGREFRPSGPGGKGRAAGFAVPKMDAPAVAARKAWRHWLTIAPAGWRAAHASAVSRRDLERRHANRAVDPAGQRARWRRARHLKRLRRQDKGDGTLAREGFAALYDAAKTCAYCACRLTVRSASGWASSDATLDHLIPLSRGGIHGLVNVAIVCASCNFRKRDKPFEDWLCSLPDPHRSRALKLWHERYGSPPEQGLLL